MKDLGNQLILQLQVQLSNGFLQNIPIRNTKCLVSWLTELVFDIWSIADRYLTILFSPHLPKQQILVYAFIIQEVTVETVLCGKSIHILIRKSTACNSLKMSLNSFPASGNFCRLLITFANSLNPDQAQQNIGPDLDPNCLTLWWYSWKIVSKS